MDKNYEALGQMSMPDYSADRKGAKAENPQPALYGAIENFAASLERDGLSVRARQLRELVTGFDSPQLTSADIEKIQDPQERRKAIYENMHLFE